MGPLSAIVALYFSLSLGETWAYWIYPAAVYGLIPILDRCVGVDLSNRDTRQEASLNDSFLYALGLYSYLPILFLLIGYGAWIISSQDISFLAALGAASTVGMSTGVGFINSHELVHRRTHLDKWLAKIVQAPTLYGHHFSVYHTKFHHHHVATPIDPTSARFGESYWRYLPRAIIGGVRAAWAVETAQYKKNKGAIENFIHNECVHTWGLSVVFVGVFIIFFGWIALPYLQLGLPVRRG
jgi:alkane 1-monooxygenase